MEEASKYTRTTKKDYLKTIVIEDKTILFYKDYKKDYLNPENQVQHWKKKEQNKTKMPKIPEISNQNDT